MNTTELENSPPQAPEGFVPHDRQSPVTDPWQPIFARSDGEKVELAIRIAPAHCNGRGFLHGGVIAALADNAMGLSLAQDSHSAGGTRRGAVTMSLSVDYVRRAEPGQWLIIAPRVVKAGRRTGTVDALITADGETVARANATFALAG